MEISYRCDRGVAIGFDWFLYTTPLFVAAGNASYVTDVQLQPGASALLVGHFATHALHGASCLVVQS